MRKAFLLSFLLPALLPFVTRSQTVQTIPFDAGDADYGHYLLVEPKSKPIDGVLVLLAGFGEVPEAIFPETKLENVAHTHRILTLAIGIGPKLYADSVVLAKLNTILTQVKTNYNIPPQNFVLGGFSAGGATALRYTELSRAFPEQFAVQPSGVFMVDSPIDIFSIWEALHESLRNRYTDIAVREAEQALAIIQADHGLPLENVDTYSRINAFNMNKAYGEPEKWLKDVAVRAYHDVDIPWRLINRNQTVHLSNYEVTAELINRLLLMGNTRAEFMQSYQTGYRANGMRHPHSWSIVDEEECITWVQKLFKEK